MSPDVSELPEKYIRWCYRGRKELVHRIAAGEDVPKEVLFLGFTRHSPTLVTAGSAGPNGSVKGVGFVPDDRYIGEFLAAYLEHIDSGWSEGYPARGLEILGETIYGPMGEDKVDFSRLATLELAKGHTWQNLKENRNVSLVFFEPPMVSFEVRAVAEIHEDGLHHEFVNAQHDVYHKPDRARWHQRPAYVFHIEEIYDNSATKDGFGRRIYKKGKRLD
jgi:hypothetical protein